ncbi:MAG: UDP-N-acetylmuramate--L-alanine ligase [Bacteroidetes bacterium]|jgi:UDP-N-acetylmuramate--alanine ligase|nr:UDP-N-acetylmuramate--L-alanine ligase [Bacteroidota bacterium]
MSTDVQRRQPPLGRIRHVHMVGIGGIGMSSIAEVLLNRGYRVTGSDLRKSEVTAHLEDLGATIYEGHAAEQMSGADVVVHSSAVQADANPETLAAEQQRIPLIPRSEMLGELMRMKFGIGVAGTHGKTTTTSMTGLVVTEGGFDPTIIVGGKVTVFGSNAVAGRGDVIVIEADEYDRTFLRLTPSVAVITNIEEDHLDIYEDLDDIKDAFVQYANAVPFFGAVVACLDDPNVQAVLGRIERRVVTYGTTRQAHVRAENIRLEGLTARFDALLHDEPLGTVELQLPGHYNVLNALAAVAVAQELEIPFEKVQQGLKAFSGVHRRFQSVGEVGGILVIDDYAHHPTEVQATLKAASEGFPDRRIVGVFQPHLYSRTRDFKEAFARSFFNADVLVVTDVYPAREEPLPGIDGALIADLAAEYGHRHVHYVADRHELPPFLHEHTRAGDVVVTLGAGDIWRSGRAFYELLQEEQIK